MSGSIKIAVFGSSQPQPGSELYETARKLGYSLAQAGWTVVTGGYRGVMEGASLGAKEAGGATIGVTTDFFRSRGLMPNPYVDEEIRIPTYAERLIKLISMCDGYVVMRGGSGTLAELFLSWELEKNRSIPQRPIVLYGHHWRRTISFLAAELSDEVSFSSYVNLFEYSDSPEETAAIIGKRLKAIVV